MNKSEDWGDINEKWDYIHKYWGFQQQSVHAVVTITIISAIILTSGLIGNLGVCIVALKYQSWHSVKNYYLFNLAVSDLTLLIFGLPNDVYLYWHLYPWPFGEFCCKFRALLSEMASYASVLTIVAFSTERYYAICLPLHSRANSNIQRAARNIIILWVVSFMCALPFSILSSINYLDNPFTHDVIEETAVCAMIKQPDNVPLQELSTIIFLVIPTLILCIQCSKMTKTLFFSTKNIIDRASIGSRSSSRRIKSEKATFRLLGGVVFGFLISWVPFHLQRILAVYRLFPELTVWLYLITGVLYYFSPTLNPILYNINSKRVRNGFKNLLKCRTDHHYQVPLRNYV